MRIVKSILSMAALVYVLISLAFGMLAWMMSGNVWQGVVAAVKWPVILWPTWRS